MSNNKSSAFRSGLSVLGKLFVGTRKGPSGERVRRLKKLQKRMGVRFTDLSLLEQALTHRSYSHVTSQTRNDSNERMEFLGDSVLGLAVSQFLYLRFPERSEGALSKMKSLLVSRKVLSSVAKELGLGEFLLLSGEESEMGGRGRASILADSFEGVIGAIYLDQGYRASNKFIQRFLLASIHDILEDEEHTNYKSLLQEYVQSRRLSHPTYRVRKEEGPEHEKEFAVDVVVKGNVWGTGRGKSKKQAEQNAARAALESRQDAGPAKRGMAESPSSAEAPSRRRGERKASERKSGERKSGERRAERKSGESRSGEERRRSRNGGEDEGRPRRGRGRRAEKSAEPVEAKDRGGHGIAASRERILEKRKAEAAERKQAERPARSRSGRGRARNEGAEPADEPTAQKTAGAPPAETAEDRPARGRRRRRSRESGDESQASSRSESRESKAPVTQAAAPVRKRSSEAEEIRASRADEPKAEEPRAEESRRTEPRAETSSTESPGAEEPKVPSREPEQESTRAAESRPPAAASRPDPEPARAEDPDGEEGGFVRRRRRTEDRPRGGDSPPPSDSESQTPPSSSTAVEEVEVPQDGAFTRRRKKSARGGRR